MGEWDKKTDIVLFYVAGYTASKGAVAAMTRTVALDVAKQGIVVNCIAPGCKSPPLLFVFHWSPRS